MINLIYSKFWNPVEAILQKDREFITRRIEWTYGTILVFYGFVTYLSINSLYALNWKSMQNNASNFSPKWPIEVMQFLFHFEVGFLARSIFIFCLITSVFGLLKGIYYKWVRVLAFLGLLLSIGLVNSFNKGSHGHHLLLCVSFILIFIPSFKMDIYENRVRIFQVLFLMRSFTLMIYFSSGLIKFYRLYEQVLGEKINAFSKNGFANLIAKDWYTVGQETILGPWVVSIESYLWPVILVSGYLIEICSGVILFFPRFDRIWALALMGLHIGILLTLGPNFSDHIFVVVLVLYFSPFSTFIPLSLAQPISYNDRQV